MRGNTSKRTERKLFVVLGVILLLSGLVAVRHAQSVRIKKVSNRKLEDGSVVFDISLFNPFKHAVTAKVCFDFGYIPDDSGGPFGYMSYKCDVLVPANETITFEQPFSASQVRIHGSPKRPRVCGWEVAHDSANSVSSMSD